MRSNLFLRSIILTAAGLLVATIIFTFLAGSHAVQSTRKMLTERLAIRRLETILSTLKDAETGQRGYLLTGKESYLEPFHDALQRLEPERQAVRELARRGQISQNTITRLDDLIRLKLTELEATVQLRRTNFAAAVAVVETDSGKKIMDEIRSVLAGAESDLEKLSERAQHDANRATSINTATFIFAGCAYLVFLAWAYQRILREIRGREAASLETLQQKQLLATTLASIGDAVIVTDKDGRVTFMNREAERLTGWNTQEARDRLLPEVFRIVHESSRKPVENPVEKVIRLGTVVGLANHTVLIARDGTETPIDDSAAPIREAVNGPMFGIVLVFRDFTEQKQAEDALRKAQDELKAYADKLEKTVEQRTARLTEMVSELQHVSYAIVHDMRAPLRAMASFAAALIEDCLDSGKTAQAKDYCRRIITGSSRLDRLITDALTYTKSVMQEFQPEKVDLDQLLRGIIETYPNLHPERADISIDGRLPVVMGNEPLLTQCFSNLLGNAVKFVSPGVRPKVRVQAVRENGMTRIVVEDNGIGIPKNAQYRLFGMFQKLDGEYEGTGIGLAIVRKVAERMGGSVGVDSEPKRGSRFWVVLHSAD